MLRFWAVPFGIALSIGPVCSQPTSLSGPVEGYTFDLPSQSFRAVIGLPGSASFGPALATGCVNGSVAPHRNYGVGFQPSKRRGVAAVGRAPAGESAINTGTLVTGLDSDPVSTRISGLSRAP